jgi:hypothetical protein
MPNRSTRTTEHESPSYQVDQRDVESVVASFTPTARQHWNCCVEVLAREPHPHHGSWAYRLVPILGWPWKTFTYEITQEASTQGDSFYLLIAYDILPDFAVAFLIDDASRLVKVLRLEDNPRV